MRKIAAILFFAVLIFNWAGYRIFFGYAQSSHNRNLSEQFDKNEYNDAELVSVKIHYPLPYIVNSSGFERWDGEVDIDGKVYKYVKRRIIKDSIEFLCLPDQRSEHLQAAKDEFFKMTNDLQQDKPSHQSDQQQVPVFKNVLSEFCQEIKDWELLHTETSLAYNYYCPAIYHDFLSNTSEQPPDCA